MKSSFAFALCLTMATSALAGEGGVFGSAASDAIAQADAATRAQILKAAVADKAVKEGLETWRQQQILDAKARELEYALTPPSTMCQTIESQHVIHIGEQVARSRIAGAQKSSLKGISTNTNTAQYVETLHAATNARFCSEEESSRGICTLSTDSKYSNFAGADQDAMFLFQGRDGTNTYEGDRDGIQFDAANSYIARVVVGVPPEQLMQSTKAKFQNSKEARSYAELLRRYNSFLSMSAYSLNKIKESRNPLK